MDGSSSCRCSTTSHGDRRTTRKNASQMLNSFLSLQKGSEQDNGHSSGLDQRKIGILSVKIVHKVNGTKWQRRFPEECLRAKVVENCRYTIAPTRERLSTIISVNRLSLHGAVSDLCDEYSACQARTVRLVVTEQSRSKKVACREYTLP